MTRLHRLLRLTPAEADLLASAWLALARARARLWLHRTADLEPPGVRGDPPRPEQSEWLVRSVAVAVARAARLVPAATCLAQALAARDLLARRGVGTDLRLGVARGEGGHVIAHAWLEHRGQVVLGGGDRSYHRLL